MMATLARPRLGRSDGFAIGMGTGPGNGLATLDEAFTGLLIAGPILPAPSMARTVISPLPLSFMRTRSPGLGI